MKYIDMHLHMENYLNSNIEDDIIYFANSVDYDSYIKTINKFGQYKNVNISFGIHPAYAYINIKNKKNIKEYMKRNLFTGEIGLDFFWVEDKSTYKKQLEIFEMQLNLSKDLGTTPSIHTKGAEEEVLKYLKDLNIRGSIIHWYSGPEDLIDKYLETGAYFTIGPDIFTGSKIYEKIPIDRVLLETDNPTGFPWVMNDKTYDKGMPDIKKMYIEYSRLTKIPLKELKYIIYNNLKSIISKACYNKSLSLPCLNIES